MGRVVQGALVMEHILCFMLHHHRGIRQHGQHPPEPTWRRRLLKHPCRPSTETISSDVLVPRGLSGFSNGFRCAKMSFSRRLDLQNSPDFNAIDKQVRWKEAPPPPRKLEDLEDLLLTSWCQIPQHLQGSDGEHALMCQSCYTAKGGPTQYINKIRKVLIMDCLVLGCV